MKTIYEITCGKIHDTIWNSKITAAELLDCDYQIDDDKTIAISINLEDALQELAKYKCDVVCCNKTAQNSYAITIECYELHKVIIDDDGDRVSIKIIKAADFVQEEYEF